MFYSRQTDEQKNKYKDYLKNIASLSRLFSENTDAYMDSRISENLFCKAFGAKNAARDDSTADAYKDGIGIGIKTFIHSNSGLQKVAEFNAIRHTYSDKTPREIIEIVSKARNERIRSTKEMYNLSELIYHCITRQGCRINIFEQEIRQIDIGSIKWTSLKDTKASISFSDTYYDYSFNKSKSVLQMKFNLGEPIDYVGTTIIENPIEQLVGFLNANIFDVATSNLVLGENAIYLPLYAPSSKSFKPGDKSGLNQWNAGGRDRNCNEVYIPIPLKLHRVFPEFFIQNSTHTFSLELPNGDVLSSKLCQSGFKGLMSNPNRELGKWLLRDVMGLEEWTLVTREILDTLEIDSVLVKKISNEHYKIDFASTGKYEEFRQKFDL
jgi:hypothetical protein